MTVQVKFLSAFFRKTDIAAHYPGGCRAFESEQFLGVGDADLYCLVAMSGGDLESALDALRTESFDPDAWVALADMWLGPLKHNPHIVFTVKGDSLPPSWIAQSIEENRHV
jgi:hypothetical protein